MSLKMYYVYMIIGPSDSFLTVLSFLENCIENGSINMNIKELHDEKTKFHISIPER